MRLTACIARWAVSCTPLAWPVPFMNAKEGTNPLPSAAHQRLSEMLVAVQVQETEIALAKAAFQKEKVRLEALWQQRKDEYSAAVETQVGLPIHCLLMACSRRQALPGWLPN